jgi:hypothetical protein
LALGKDAPVQANWDVLGRTTCRSCHGQDRRAAWIVESDYWNCRPARVGR